MSELKVDEFISLVEAASLAPSADNRHLFELEYAGHRIRMWAKVAFLRAPGHLRVAYLIGFGAAVENMTLRAGALGLQTSVRWFPAADQPRLTAELAFARGTTVNDDPTEAAIPQRHTNRRLRFRGPALTARERQLLEAEAGSIPRVVLTWFDTRKARHRILRLVRIAETERFRSRSLHQEMFSSIRFDVGWRSTTEEGLPPGSLEIGIPMRPVFRSLRRWWIACAARVVGGHYLFGVRAAYLPCRLAPHVGVLSTEADPEELAPAVGAAFERFWLRACSLNLSIQPFAGAAFLALPQCQGVSPDVRKALCREWGYVLPGHTALVIFRLGRAAPPTVRTARQALAKYIADAGNS